MRFCGNVGYVKTEETSPGVYEEIETERKYYGDVTRHSTRWSNGDGINDNILVTNDVSILADPFAYENFAYMRYVEFMGAKWKISSLEVERPRIKLTLGGLYNETES